MSELKPLDSVLDDRPSTIARDLNLNLKRLVEDSSLSPVEANSTLLACATSVGHQKLATHARENLAQLGQSHEQIQEAAESAAIMGMLNVYYRFRHFVAGEGELSDDYKAAGLRMTALARPVLGKTQFEMLAFAVSCINGCETCVRSHEQALRQHGLEAGKIHDLARIAAVVKGLQGLSLA